MLALVGNVIWFVLGGVLMGLGWWLIGVLCFITLIGVPWGRACFVMGQFCFFPFGKVAVNRKDLHGSDDLGTGSAGVVGNVIWVVLAGIWLALGHIISAIACFLTIIGIPFGIQHLKLAAIAVAPIGKTVVSKAIAEEKGARSII